MAEHVLIEIEMPPDLNRFSLPEGVQQRLQSLLDKQGTKARNLLPLSE